MTKIPLTQPSLPGYIENPEKPEELDLLREVLIQHAIWVLGNEYATEKKMPYVAYIDSLTVNEKSVLINRATMEVVGHLDSIANLVERTGMDVAFRVFRGNMFRSSSKEYDTMEEFLLDKIKLSKSPASVSEAMFLLQLFDTFEKNGKKGYADKLFKNPHSYGKMVAAIPFLRRKQNQLFAIERTGNETIAEIKKSGDSPEVKKQVEEISERVDKEKEKGFTDLRVAVKSAIDLAGSPVDRSAIPAALPVLTKTNLEKEGYKPAEISKDYEERSDDEEKAKPMAYMADTGKSTIFAMSVKNSYAGLVKKLLGTMFEVHTSEIDEVIDIVSSSRKKEPMKKKEKK